MPSIAHSVSVKRFSYSPARTSPSSVRNQRPCVAHFSPATPVLHRVCHKRGSGMATDMAAFTPWHALSGGAALGCLSAGKTIISSRILGISGALKGLVNLDWSSWRWFFTGGMLAGGIAVSMFMPSAIETFPATYTVTRAAAAGLMVGLGAGMGNGCTSGHGIAGNARLSLRSAAYTCVFMAAGAATVALTGTMDALQVTGVPQYQALAGEQASQALALLGTAALGTLSFAALASSLHSKLVSVAYEAFAGFVFALGLGFTGMSKASKVASFLAVGHPSFDASLAFVMGGALLVATPLFQAFIKHRKAAADGAPMSLPCNSTIDAQLVLGGLLFGCGWGLGGMCPGPVLVAISKPQPQTLALFLCMLAGLRLSEPCKQFLAPKKAKS